MNAVELPAVLHNARLESSPPSSFTTLIETAPGIRLTKKSKEHTKTCTHG